MSHPLDSCIAKWNQAMVHLDELKELTSAFIKDGAYSIHTDVDRETHEYVLLGRVHKEPPALAWAMVIGNVVSNLRASLDHLVWQLTAANSGPAPPDPLPYNSPWRQVRFPVLVRTESWPSAVGRNLWGVRPGLRQVFELLQPFRTGKDAPCREPLAVLDELWNIDKHRHPHLTQSFIGAQGIRSALRDMVPPGYRLPEWFDHSFNVIAAHPPGPFKDGAELGRYTEGGATIVAMGHMYVRAELVFDVAFDEGAPAYGGRLIETLWTLQETVHKLIARFQAEFT